MDRNLVKALKDLTESGKQLAVLVKLHLIKDKIFITV